MVAGIIPGDILEDIFTRLPVKSVITLTVICKSWLALISSPSFVKLHLSQYSLRPDNHSLLLHRPCRDTVTISPLNFLGIPPISVLTIPAAENPLLPIYLGNGENGTPSTSVAPICFSRNRQLHQESWNSMLTLVGSINGLVCFSRATSLRPTNVVIWNPATHRFKDIVVPRLNLNKPFRIYVAFGYDCAVDDYKVVCIYRFRVGADIEMSFRFRMYSCKTDSWKELIPDFPFYLGFILGCVAVKGNLYWMGFYQQSEIWVTVNVGTEEIRVFSGPEYVKDGITSKSIMALGDSVAQVVYSSNESNFIIHVYILYEISGVWTNMYTIESIGLEVPVLLQCYKNGKFVMKDNQGKLFTYDLVSKEIKDLGVGEGMEAPYMSINYTESLVAIEGMELVREKAAEQGVREEAAEQGGQETALATSDRNGSDAMMLQGID